MMPSFLFVFVSWLGPGDLTQNHESQKEIRDFEPLDGQPAADLYRFKSSTYLLTYVSTSINNIVITTVRCVKIGEQVSL
jgi:hypothetical protein